MIKATDLRIGNILYIDSTTFKKCPITVGSIFEKGINGVPSETGQTVQYIFAHLKEIHLDDEILEKCGFVEKGYVNQDQDDVEWMEHADLPDLKYRNGYFKFGYFEFHHIQYLHQLQNLYFALTGEELTVNLGTPVEAS